MDTGGKSWDYSLEPAPGIDKLRDTATNSVEKIELAVSSLKLKMQHLNYEINRQCQAILGEPFDSPDRQAFIDRFSYLEDERNELAQKIASIHELFQNAELLDS
jgi:hypothetical protein